MASLRGFVGRVRRIAVLDREVARLQHEVRTLREQNERMRSAMRRCNTCDYRLAVRDDLRPGPPPTATPADPGGGPR